MSRQAASSDVFHAVADGSRRALLDRLARRDANVGELAAHTRLSYSAASQHLTILLAAGLVRRRRSGREQIYRLSPLPLRRVHAWTAHYERFWRQKLARLRDVLEEGAGS